MPPALAIAAVGAGEAARLVLDLDAQPHQPPAAHQAAHQHGGQQAGVDIAARDDQADATAPEAFGMGQHGCERGGPRALGHGLLDLGEQLHALFHRCLIDEQDVFDQFAHQRQGQHARPLDGDALGDSRAARRRRKAAQRVVHGRVAGRLDADDAGLRAQRLRRKRYAGDEPPPPTGTTRKSRPDTVRSISSPTVPCPATMRASS